jgi:hypothetical protein
MNISIKIKKVGNLSEQEIEFMNSARIAEYGDGAAIDFKKEDKKGIFFFVNDSNETKAFGMLKPVSIEHKDQIYHILAMGRGMAIIKGKGYGRVLNEARVKYATEKRKTLLAFTSRENKVFFEKVGFKVEKQLINKFRYKNPKTGEIIIDEDGDGVYYEGKDKIITKIINSSEIAYISVPFW